MNSQNTIEFNKTFLEFIDYLIQLGYGEEPSGFIQGVFQRAFFDEWIKFLGFKKQLGSPFKHIKEELLETED
ncbi:MAG: hypothetical protein ACTSW1_07200 [Candidatus Hodarchaeales archaeon]